MRDPRKLGVWIVVGASFALVHCSGDDVENRSPAAGGTAGSSSTGTSGTSGKGGSSTSTGASGSSGVAGSAGSGGGSAGSGGIGGSAGAGGSGGIGGSSGVGGAAGATGGSSGSGDAGRTDGAAGSPIDARSTDAAEAGPVSCPDESVGASDAGTGDAGASDAGTTTTAIVLVDNVVIRDATNTNVVAQWQFDNASTIAEAIVDPRPADQWSRPPYSPINTANGAKNTFIACAGNPAAGSMKEVIPFTARDQYYEVSVLFAEHDYSSHRVSAKVKLVIGGRSEANCPAHAHLYAIDAAITDAGFPRETPPAPITLVTGQWQDVALTIPVTGFTRVRELGVRITTYVCQ
jgi:hypothetical protein